MRNRGLTALASGVLVVVACNDESETPRLPMNAVIRQELLANAPLTLDARLSELPNGRWRAHCFGRFRKLSKNDANTYDAFVSFFEEGSQTAIIGGQVTPASPTLNRSALGNVFSMTHPSSGATGELSVLMHRTPVDPSRRQSCQVVIEQNGTEVARLEARAVRHFARPTGTFTDTGQAFGTDFHQDVALGDIDGDGDIDSVVASFFAPIRVWLNDGAGNFTDGGQALGGNDTTGAVALGDMDGDGDLDLFQASYAYDPGRLWKNDGGGVFTDSGQSLFANVSNDVAIGDVDGDGDLDALVSFGLWDTPQQAGGTRLFRNDGTGVFSNQPGIPSVCTTSIALGDVNGDGDLDVLRGEGPCGFNSVEFNDGSGAFPSVQNLAPHATRDVALGDVDGDGDLDAVLANLNQGSKIWLNNGSGTFTNSGQSFGGHATLAIALGDIDGDGDLDIFQGNDEQASRVFRNNGAGVFSDSGQALGSHATQGVALADLDSDGDLDTFQVNTNSGSGNQPNRVWRNQ